MIGICRMRLGYRFLLLLMLAVTLIGCGTLPSMPLAIEQHPAAYATVLSPEPSAAPGTRVPSFNNQLRVHFIDVGQGDSVLIQTPSGATMLIDGGYSGTGALAYLKAQRITKIDVMVANHPHA